MGRKEYKFVDHAESVHRTVCFAAIFQEHNIAQSRESIQRGGRRDSGQSWLEMTASLPVPCLRHTRTLEHEPKRISTHRQLLEESGREKGNGKSPEFLTRVRSTGCMCVLIVFQRHFNKAEQRKRDGSSNCSTC